MIPLTLQLTAKVWPKTAGPSSSEFAIFRATLLPANGSKEESKRVVGIKGKLAELSVGDTITTSEYESETHDQYGETYQVNSHQVVIPQGVAGIQHFLQNIMGIGPTTARWIVEAYGEKSLEVIEKDGVEAIRRIKNAYGNPAIRNEARLHAIHKAIMERTKEDDARMELKRLGFNSAQVAQILQSYSRKQDFSFSIGPDGEPVEALVSAELTPLNLCNWIKADPYGLRKLPGIGFKTCDTVALRFGIPLSHPSRIAAGIEYCLDEVRDSGSTAAPCDWFAMQAAKALSVDIGHVRNSLKDHQGVVEFADTYSSLYLAEIEQQIAAWVFDRVGKVTPLQVYQQYQEGNIVFSEDQSKAVSMALSERVCIVTGGPGTGKTTITKEIVRSFLGVDKYIVLGSPTGRAASVLQKVTGYEAATTYRMLGYVPSIGQFSFNADNQLYADCVLLDETSMIGVQHFWDIIQAIPRSCRLILVGDADQLPSVAAGRVLQDLIESNTVPYVKLEKIFRQAEGSKIVTNAHAVRLGQEIQSGSDPESDDFFVTLLSWDKDWPEKRKKEARQDGQDMVLKVVSRIEERFGYKDIQVMYPMHKGSMGTKELNERLRELRNPRGHRIAKGRYRIGDRVIVTKNLYGDDYDLDKGFPRMNGEVGVIINYREMPEEMDVQFGNDITTFRSKYFNMIQLAYAMTIHKSQGSQFEAVVICMHTSHWHMAVRDLLYTAITRAQKLCCLIGTEAAIRKAIKTVGGGGRVTRLKEWMDQIKEGGYNGEAI